MTDEWRSTALLQENIARILNKSISIIIIMVDIMVVIRTIPIQGAKDRLHVGVRA